jgi:hypothetical protein
MKKEILPNVVVYKKRFTSIEKTYEFFKTLNENSNLISDFKSNHPIYGWATESFMFSSLYKDFENKDDAGIMTEIIKIRKETLNDYVTNNCKSEIWPLDLEKKYPFDDPTINSGFAVTKTFHHPDFANVRHRFFHLDNIPNPSNEFDKNHIITTMIYLNDNYEFGEIKFYNKNYGFVYYKPEAGDVLVFPSFYPFYHNPNMPVGQNRYAIRSSYDEVVDNSLLLNNATKFENYIDKDEYYMYNSGKTEVLYINGKDL